MNSFKKFYLDAPDPKVEDAWVTKIRREKSTNSTYLYVAYGTKGLVIYNIDNIN